MRRLFVSLLVLPTVLGGCLLPQPDTPPIGPYSGAAPNSRSSTPAKTAKPSASPETAGTAVSAPLAPSTPSAAPTNETGASMVPTPAPGTLSVRLAGEGVREVVLTPLAGGEPTTQAVVGEGFTVTLPAGGYTLDLGAGREVAVAVKAGGTTEITITVSATEVTVTYKR